MIHLDTSVLIDITTPGSAATSQVDKWFQEGQELAVSAPAWFEYVSGPVTPEAIKLVRTMLRGGIIPFEMVHAEKAAEFFNRTGRKRALKFDCMIAAAAFTAKVPLATSNHADFSLLVPFGLSLELV